MKSSGKGFLRVSTQRLDLQRRPLLSLVLAAKLGSVRATQVLLVLKARRGRGEQMSLGTMKKACEGLLVEGQPSYSGDPRILEMLVAREDHEESSRSSGVEPAKA